MNIAGVLQLIQDQQRAEERKEERNQQMALNLLSMEMREAESSRDVLLREYYDKKEQVAETKKMFDQYRAIDPDFKSPGGMDMVNIVDNQNKVDMSALTQNLDALNVHQAELESSLVKLQSQGQKLRESQLDYAGPEGILQQHEYEKFKADALKAVDEGGLGWATTAGADVEFYKTDPTTRQLAATTEVKKMKVDLKEDADTQYGIIQGVFTAKEDYESDDILDALTYENVDGKNVVPDEEVIGAIQRLVSQSSTYDNFMDNLAAFPSDAGGDYIRAELMNNPNINLLYNDLQSNYRAINVLDNELAGINQPPIETSLENFVSDIENITNPKVLFGLYDEAIKGQDVDVDNDPFFSAVEAQLGVEDASGEYLKHKGLSTLGKVKNELSKDESELISEINQLDKEIESLSQFYGITSNEVTERKMEKLNLEMLLNNIIQEKRLEKGQSVMDTTITELSTLTGLSEEEIAQQVEDLRKAGVPWEGVREELLGGLLPGKSRTTRLGPGHGRMY